MNRGVSLAFLLLGLFGYCNATYKRWLPDTDFENPLNWNAKRAPCGNDRVIIPEESPVIYMQMNTTLKELTLPRNGELILGNNIQLAFVEQASADCPQVGGDLEFENVHASQWVNPDNWCTSQTELGDCLPNTLLETERIPCLTDDVVFLPHHSYFVDLGHDLQLKVKSLKILGQSFTTTTFTQFLNGTDGKKMFQPSSTGIPTSVTVSRQECKDLGGCVCGNDQIKNQICAIIAPNCARAKCNSPVLPAGACCSICGVVMNGTRGNGFNMTGFKSLLKSAFFNNSTSVQTSVSLTADGIVQIVLQDTTGQASAQLAAMIKADVDQDLKTGGHKYALESLTMTGSIYEHGGTSAATLSMPTSSIIGFVIGLVILLIIVVAIGLIFCRRGRPLPKFPNMSSLPSWSSFGSLSRNFRMRGEGSRQTARVPPTGIVSFIGGSMDPGFANPLYDTSPFDDGNEQGKVMELSPMEEQPTFDLTSGGFNNPLYGSVQDQSKESKLSSKEDQLAFETVDIGIDNPLYGAGPMFTDPAKVSETSVEMGQDLTSSSTS